MTKIVHITPNIYPRLNAEHHTKNIWRELSKVSEDYKIFGRNSTNSITVEKEGNLTLYRVPKLTDRQFSFVFSSLMIPLFLFRDRPEVIILQCPVLGGIPAIILKKIFRCKIITEFHGDHYFENNNKLKTKFYKYITNIVINNSDVIRSLSPSMSNKIYDCYCKGRRDDRVKIVPNRVDFSVFKKYKTSYDILEKPKFITAGRLSRIKNHKALIDMLYSTYGNDFSLCICGHGTLYSELKNHIRSLCLEKQVQLLGNLSQEKLNCAMIESDIYIHYSTTEAVPRAILEAMAVGLPVMSSNVGFIEGVITNDTGVLFDLKDPVQIKRELLAMSNKKDIRNSLGRNARNRIRKHFDSNITFDKYREMILDLIYYENS